MAVAPPPAAQMTERQKQAAMRKAAKLRFSKARIAEREYQRSLVAVGRQVGSIINGYTVQNPLGNQQQMYRALESYSRLIEPWAQSVTERMHSEVGWRDLRSWKALANQIGRGLTVELAQAPVGVAFSKLMAEQVTLIKSLPLEAGQRVHQLTQQALIGGARLDEIVPEILRSGQVTVSRAKLIARTETARTSSVLTQVRAEHVGSDSYIWRTAQDAQVREEHRKLEGKTILWSQPPIAAANGTRYHAGQGPNCRCYPEPLLND
jgi:SPP1 gp7 family putative phage head morphogenesis protein